ncbi:MAG: ATP phosphoribosyltransferase, partial [Candidatus Hadarchaeales archaeon]
MTEILLAIPNKGRLYEPTMRLLEDAGFGSIDRGERQLFAKTRDPSVMLVFARAQDIPKLVERGAMDLGITGLDLVIESGSKLVELLDLEYGKAKLVVAVSESSGIKKISDIPAGSRVATEFPKIASEFFKKKKIRVEISEISGSAEITPLIGMADLVVDLVSTGTTMKMHGLTIIEEILDTSARLFANPTSLKNKRQKIEQIKTAIESVVRARGKKLILMNIPAEKLDEIKKIVPGMSGPTVSKVEAEVPMLAIQAVVEAQRVDEVVRRAKQ